MNDFLHARHHWVTLDTPELVPALYAAVDARDLPGMADVSRTEHSVSFLYTGEMPALIAALQGLAVADLTITEPDLEEVFLHFYQNGGTPDDHFHA